MFRKHPKLFSDPLQRYPIYDTDLPFADYIAQCKALITHTRLDLAANTNQIIEANSPFELRPQGNEPKYGALLIHGLLDSPFVMRDIGNHLQANGGLVRSVLLPGHGTIPGGLLSVDYHDWQQTIRYGVTTLAKEVDKIFLVGFSTGATLALDYALQQAIPIAGLILVSPAIKIRSIFDFALNWHRLISWAWPRANWVSIQEEKNYISYKSLAFNGAYQLYQLIQEINQLSETKSLPCPLFFVLSEDDITVSSQASLNYFQKQKDQQNRLILYTNKTQKYNDSRIILRRAAYPKMHIENLSHLCIPISPTNYYYGRNGSYIYASRVEDKNNTTYIEATQIKIDFYNFLYKLNLRSTPCLRTTFNPDFDFMMESIHSFLENVI